MWEYIKCNNNIIQKHDVILCLGSYGLRVAETAASLWLQQVGLFDKPEAKVFEDRAAEIGGASCPDIYCSLFNIGYPSGFSVMRFVTLLLAFNKRCVFTKTCCDVNLNIDHGTIGCLMSTTKDDTTQKAKKMFNIIDKCPQDVKDTVHGETPLEHATLADLVPVWSPSRRRIYRSQYVSRCHNVSDGQIWPDAISCRLSETDKSTQSASESIDDPLVSVAKCKLVMCPAGFDRYDGECVIRNNIQLETVDSQNSLVGSHCFFPNLALCEQIDLEESDISFLAPSVILVGDTVLSRHEFLKYIAKDGHTRYLSVHQ
ncbi:hypothetical protein DPMN_189350 [Dreissena polymorpha]|uniref:Uncharacterized protein n=1 Tax=Dreissena polymorpha TaxID=45954 RepID=A0A9D4DVD7_DREPO|nr:hypothetical protein DPMN_189350 [Dreissena polymorpha]